VVVEDRVLDRNRQRLLSAEANGVVELARVVDACDLERAHTDAAVRDAEANVAARKVMLVEELAQGLGELLRLAQLAAHDDAVLELLPCDM